MIDMRASDYRIDAVRGFLPAKDPLASLGDPYYRPWEETVARLPKLLGTKRVRHFLQQLPLLSVAGLAGEYQLNRAMTILSYFGHAYVWGEDAVVESLPENLALPWFEVARALGRPPVLSYASHALFNWSKLDAEAGIELGNLARIENFYGGIDEDWFVLVHVAIEAKAGPAISKLIDAQQAVIERNPLRLLDALSCTHRALGDMVAVLRRMPENCDPYVYYHKMRKFIFGWLNPALPNGVRYEGVEEWRDRPQKFRGETGAQSAIIPAIDAVLGIEFEKDNPFYRHLVEMREYMPPPHRKFIEDLERNAAEARMRDYIVSVADEWPALAQKFDDTLQQNHKFRNLHLKYAREYINNQVQRSSSSPVDVGTGGTPFMQYLGQHQQDVLSCRIEPAKV
jgi:indoleamine 2,3-dioxygenase